jgi:hypothetical protein
MEAKSYPLIRIAFLIVISLTYIFFLFYYPFAFNYEVGITYHYYLICLYQIGLLAVLIMAKVFKYSFSILDLFVLLWLLIFDLLLLFKASPGPLSNEYASVCFIVSVIYLITRVLAITLQDKAIRLLLLTGFIIQLIIVSVQLSNNELLNLIGTLENTGVFSSYLVMHVPLLYFIFFKLNNNRHSEYKWILGVLFFVLSSYVLAISILNSSRAAILVFIMLAIVILRLEVGPKHFKNWKLLVGIGIIGICIASALLNRFQYKILSTKGRLMQIDVCKEHLFKNLWTGVGLGKFSFQYPFWQAEYFCSKDNIPVDYFLSAGESYVLYNEYLQLFLELGCVGFSFGIIILVAYFRCKTIPNDHLMSYSKLTLVVILMYACVSYPFYCTFFLFLIAISISTAFSLGGQESLMNFKPFNRMVRSLIPFLILIFIICSYKSFQVLISVVKFEKLYGDYFKDPVEIVNEYAVLDKNLGSDGKFLLAYGEALMMDSATVGKGIDILERSKLYFTSYRTFNSTALGYIKMHSHKGAIDNFTFLSCLVPSEFYPKYQRALLYHAACDSMELRRVSEEILTMPVKIPSSEVDRIKKEIILLKECSISDKP